MSSKRVLISSVLSVALLGSLASSAWATTYLYTGNNFGSVSGLYTTAMSVDLSVTLSITLGANLVEHDAYSSITSFTATDGVQVITQTDTLADPEFIVSTDAGGNIVEWSADFGVPGGSPSRLYSCTTGIGNGSICVSLSASEDSGAIPSPAGSGFVFNNPGSWVTVIPEPSSALLIGMGLAGLALRRRESASSRSRT